MRYKAEVTREQVLSVEFEIDEDADDDAKRAAALAAAEGEWFEAETMPNPFVDYIELADA